MKLYLRLVKVIIDAHSSSNNSASILKIMLGFGEYRHQYQATKTFKSPYEVIVKD